MSERVRMGLLGFGTVGSAFYRLVEKSALPFSRLPVPTWRCAG